MLIDQMNAGVVILGLAELIGSGRPAFAGCYRITSVGTIVAIEFYEKTARKDAATMFNIGILPYQPGRIAEMRLNDSEEVISGEFTGCVMSLYRKSGALYAAHVDTNKESSQRGAYDALKSTGAAQVVKESDTTGLLTTPNTIALCIANKNDVKTFVVSKSTHASFKKAPVPGEPGKFTGGQFGETMYTILP